MDKFERALILAYEGHKGQVDKGGKPYIQHLMRVAGSVDPSYMSVAILHDYFEDVVKLSKLHEIELYLPFLTEDEIFALYLLTRSDEYTYAEYIQRIKDSGSRIAINVKREDLMDHIINGKELTTSLSNRYWAAIDVLNSSVFHSKVYNIDE